MVRITNDNVEKRKHVNWVKQQRASFNLLTACGYLLEDDDEDVRTTAAQYVSRILKETENQQHHNAVTGDTHVSLLVDIVNRTCKQFVTSVAETTAGHENISPSILSVLRQPFEDALASSPSLVTTAANAVSVVQLKAVFSRTRALRLFEVESVNQHVEPALQREHAGVLLTHLISTKAKSIPHAAEPATAHVANVVGQCANLAITAFEALSSLLWESDGANARDSEGSFALTRLAVMQAPICDIVHAAHVVYVSLTRALKGQQQEQSAGGYDTHYESTLSIHAHAQRVESAYLTFKEAANTRNILLPPRVEEAMR
jgi:hypothetical protein